MNSTVNRLTVFVSSAMNEPLPLQMRSILAYIRTHHPNPIWTYSLIEDSAHFTNARATMEEMVSECDIVVMVFFTTDFQKTKHGKLVAREAVLYEYEQVLSQRKTMIALYEKGFMDNPKRRELINDMRLDRFMSKEFSDPQDAVSNIETALQVLATRRIRAFSNATETNFDQKNYIIGYKGKTHDE
ncbi:hypothetical protein [Deinococcus roseus]|uniref:CD-NTase-associated protein 12/Pycsar effector protein TIR domain-containing protein n=1 Tax=Deinococcus roseus TaxID=392414 RepID=A0ABQ2D759_9DEIO|nr:hypothetical protein [Deinococcus roseus]GGJ43943.1 hypothetical protein GCM10008938_32750 [Deinococcus roseus]